MEFLNNPQLLYLIGVLWIINGTVFFHSFITAITGAESFRDTDNAIRILFVGVISWAIGLGHIVYAFFV